jgi:hypothetical protein
VADSKEDASKAAAAAGGGEKYFCVLQILIQGFSYICMCVLFFVKQKTGCADRNMDMHMSRCVYVHDVRVCVCVDIHAQVCVCIII